MSINNIPGKTPLSCAQKRLLNFLILKKHDANLNITAAIEFSHELNETNLKKSLQYLVDTQDVLRSAYVINATDTDESYSVIYPQFTIDLQEETVVINVLSEQSINHIIQRTTLITQTKKYHLHKVPNFVFKLTKLVSHDHETRSFLLTINFHHILLDDWSINVFVKELIEAYQAYNNNDTNFFSKKFYQYSEYVANEATFMLSDAYQKKKKFLVSYLSGTLGEDDRQQQVNKFVNCISERENLNLDKAILERIKIFCKNNKLTLFQFFMAVYAMLLCRYKTKNNIFIGFPIAGRTRKNYLNIIGTFVNVLIMKIHINNKMSFLQLCSLVKEQAILLYTYQDIPFEQVISELNPQNMSNFRTALSLQCIEEFNMTLNDNVVLKSHYVEDLVEDYDLLFSIVERKENLIISLKYNLNILSKNLANNFMSDCHKIISAIV